MGQAPAGRTRGDGRSDFDAALDRAGAELPPALRKAVHGALGAQNAICGGGRYNGLAESIGSKLAAPGVGFSIGEDRLIMAVEDKFSEPKLAVYLAPLDEASFRHCSLLARDLRDKGLSVELAAPTKPRRAMELADKLRARTAIMVGDNELKAGVYAVKHMATGEQESLSREPLLERLLNHV